VFTLPDVRCFFYNPIQFRKNPLNYSNKKVLITGGLGFIGSALARALVDLGAQVTLVDSLIPQYGGNIFNVDEIRDQVTVNYCDVRDSFAMEYLVKGVDVLFNLAGQTSHLDSMLDPHSDLDINTKSQLSILESCRKANPEIKVVFASTRQLYGKPDYLPVDESHPIRPVDVNGINKFAGESYHLLYNNVYGVRACALRLTNTYGPGMRVKDARQTFLGPWVRQLIEGTPIQVFGDGLQVRDFNYVDDCVQAFLLSGYSDVANGKVYNLGSSEVISLKDLAAMLVSLGQPASLYDRYYEVVPFPSERKIIDIGSYYSDFSLITRELGWVPHVSLAIGLAQTINFYQRYARHYW
jgi:UDP-glucose 4-epimerase